MGKSLEAFIDKSTALTSPPQYNWSVTLRQSTLRPFFWFPTHHMLNSRRNRGFDSFIQAMEPTYLVRHCWKSHLVRLLMLRISDQLHSRVF
jgi:hypothetical protein